MKEELTVELLVCVKQVPDDAVAVTLDENGEAKLDGITHVVNAFDTYALEMAARFTEANGGSVTVLSIGDEETLPPLLRGCLAVGPQHAYAVKAPASGSPLSWGYALGQAADKLAEAPFDVIFCGCESTDTANGQLGIELAEQLGLPVIPNIRELSPSGNGGIVAKQETEEGYRVIEAPCPCVVTVVKPGYEPRYPSIKSKLAARKMPVNVLSLEDAGADAEKAGAEHVRRTSLIAPPKRQGGVKLQEKDAADNVAQAMALLTERHLV